MPDQTDGSFHCVKKVEETLQTLNRAQIGKFENCMGDFQAGMKMAQIVFQFEMEMRISAYNFYIQYK